MEILYYQVFICSCGLAPNIMYNAKAQLRT